jgi:hypothetical protein
MYLSRGLRNFRKVLGERQIEQGGAAQLAQEVELNPANGESH